MFFDCLCVFLCLYLKRGNSGGWGGIEGRKQGDIEEPQIDMAEEIWEKPCNK